MSKNEELLARRAAIMPKAVPQVTMATVASAKGALLIDADGNELIDFAGGIAVMSVGHCQPSVIQAVTQQVARLQHTCIQVATYEPYIALCEKLASLLPHGERTKVMLINTGAEAVENAVKIARQATGRAGVICFTEGFHGRTLLCLTLTSKVGYKQGCGPFAPEVYRLPFPNHYKYGDGLDRDAFVERELRRVREALSHTVSADGTAAILIEPVQGEGGFVPAPAAYLRGLRKICDEHGIMLIFDEVQSGFCRTGRWAAYEHAGVTPDISCWAKAMGGGLPIAAVLGRADIMDAAKPGTLGSTYGGNPVSCASALATIKLMEELNLNARANEVGRRIRDRFTNLAQRCDAIGDVRGLGAMIGVELVENGDVNKPATALTAALTKACVLRGVLVIPAGTHGNVIRILCPLVITDEQLDRGLGIIEEELLRAWKPSPTARTREPAGPVAR